MARTFNNLKKTVGASSGLKTKDEKKAFKDLKVSDYDFSLVKSKLENSIRFDTFQTDLSSMGKTIGDISGGWQTQETMNNTRASVESMKSRINAYEEYRKLFGNNDTPDLSELATSYGEVLGNWDERAKTYGKYKDADSYTKAMKDAEETLKIEESKKTANLDDVQKEIDGLEGILKTANQYEYDIQTLKNKTNTWEHRSNGLKTDVGIGGKLSAKEKEYADFLKNSGYENADTLKKAISDKKIYKNTAKLIQDGIELEKIRDDAKYKEYVTKGEALGNEKEDGWLVPDDQRKNTVAYLRNNPDVMEAFEEAAKSSGKKANRLITEGSAEFKLAKYGTKDQVETYYAYLGMDDKESADKYLKAIENTLNERMGANISKDKESTFEKLIFGITAGSDQFDQGMINLFNTSDDYIPPSPTQIASGQVRESLGDVGFEFLGSSFGQGAYDFITTTTNMAPSIATSYLANAILPGSGAIVGPALMGGSAAGNSYQEKLNLGWDKNQAKVYSAVVGVSEGALQYALGGIGSLGGKISGKSAQAIARGIDNAAGRFALTYGMRMASEGIEEGLQEVLNPFFENLALGYNKNDLSDIEWEQVAYSGMLGALSAGFLEGGSTASNVFGENHKAKGVGADIRSSGQVSDMLDIAKLTPQESAAFDLYTKYANKGVNAENVSDLQLGRLYVNAEADAQATLNKRKVNPVQGISAMETLHKLKTVEGKVTESKQIAERVAEMNTGEVTEETSTGNSFTIEGIKIGEEDTKLVTSEGEMSLNDVTLSQNDAELVAYAEGMDEKIANLFIAQYDGQTKVSDYASSFNLVTDYARLNYTQDAILDHKGVLTEKQVGAIYAETVKATFEEQQNAIRKLSEKYGATLSIQGTFDDSVIDYNNTTTDGSKVNWKELTSTQRGAIKFAQMFSKATGVNIKFIKSDVKDGKHQGENGSYNPETNTIEVDVFAGRIDAKAINDSIIPTLSHEITHWAKYKAPAIYNALREEIMGTLSKNSDWTTSERVIAEMNRLKEAHPDMEVTPEDAIDEIVARACEDMLANSNSARKLLAKMSASEQQDFISKVKETFNNLMQWVNDLLSHYKSESEEAKILREYKHNLKKASKMWDEMLVSAVEANKALQKEGITGEELVNGISKDGTTIVGKNNIQMSERTYAEGGRDFLKNWLEEQDLSAEDKKNILEQTDAIAKLMKDIRENNELPEYARWATMDVAKDENGEKVLSVIVKNGDYAMNIDFSQVCKKRVALNAVLNAMVQSGDLNAYTLTETDVAELNAIIKKHEFEIACALCFVDSKRYRVGSWAESFCEGANKKKNGKMVHQHGFNEMVRSLIPKGSNIKVDEFNFTNREIVGQPTENLLSEMDDSELDFTLIDEILEREYNEGKKPTDLYAYAKAIKDNKDLRKILNPAEIISSIGLDAIRLEKPELYRLINRHQGTAKPKFAHDVVAYTNDVLKASNFTKEKAKMVGGVRCQSFSDFMANMVFDYVQFVSELSAKELTAHSYTKEPLFVKLFGLTGMKINMSLVPKAIQMTPEQQEYFAILNDPNANKRSAEYRQAKRDYNKLTENAGLDENGNYIWEDETFPYDIAMELVVDPRYSANCGTIAVGISDNHILKLLADDRISMVIPYHKSGLNHIVAMMRNIDLYNDYTKTQNTRFANGKKLEGVPDFDFYGDLYGVDGKEGTHDPKKTAENYLKWCDEHNYIPKFEKSRLDRKFRDNPNYYKLLIDFRVYDTDGTYREQQAVKPIYPSNKEFKDLILNGVVGKDGTVYGGLKQQQGVSDKLSKESQQIIDEYRERMKEKHGKDVFAKKHSDRQVIDIPFNTYETMEGHFGTTKNYDVAGYLLRDGKMLDFSGKHWGGGASTSRQVDHRDIQEVLEDSDNGVTAMMSMISNGNIRLMPEVGGINLSAEPNGFQHSVLRGYINHFKGEVIVDIDAYGGDTIHSFEYSRGTSADKILSDLEGYFRRGEIPTRTKSELADFHMQYSDRQITINMSEDERYEILKDKKITPPTIEIGEDVDIDFDYLEKNIKSAVEKGLLKKFRELGLLKTYKSIAIGDISFDFTGKGYGKSIHSQTSDYGGSFADFAKVILNLQRLLDSSVLLEIHSDKGVGTPRENPQLKQTYVLFNAFEDNGYIKPVQFEVKEYVDQNNRLYLAVALTKIETSVVGNTMNDKNQTSTYLLPVSNISISEIFAKINPSDKNFLKYIPNQFLNEEQIAAKEVALDIEREKYSSKTQFSDRDSEGNTLTKEQQEFFEDSQARDKDGNLMLVFHGSPEFFTIFDTHKDTSSIIYDASFFTSDESKAKAYADKNNTIGYLYKGYLDIKNPLMPSKVREQISLIPDSVKEQYQSEFNIEEMVSRTDYAIIDFAKYVARKENSTMATILKSWGFDGYMNGTDYAIFEPEQFKSIDNTNPTSNPDYRYSDRQTETIYDKMGETERLAKENELLKADLDRLQERLKLEGTVTKGDRYDKRKLGLIAGHLRNIAKSTTSNETLVPMLEEAFGYMARLDDPDSYNGTMRRLNQIADALLQEAKPETVSDAYAKLILRDIRGKGIKLTETQVQEAKRLYGENYRNAFWGKVIIAKDGMSLDSKWQEWASKYPAYFDANVTEGDQVGALLDIYNGLRDLSEMLVEYDRAEVTRWLAQEVLNQFWNLKPITTIADKYEKRIKELNFEHRKRMAELRDDYADRMKKEKAEIRQKTAERLKELRDRKDAEIAEVKKLSKERMDKYKENAERKTVIQRITGNALTLNKWLTKNSKDYHIHKAMQGPVVKLLQAIDFSSKRMLEKGDPTQKDVSFGEAFAEVRAMLADADNMVEGLEALYGHDLAEDIKRLVETSYRLVGDNNFVLNAMSNEELQSLDKLVRHIKKVVSELNKFHTIHHNQGAVNLANEFMEHGERIGNLKKQHGKIGKSLEFRNKTPYYFFKHLGEAGKKVFEAFQDGWDKLSFNAKKIIDFAEETYTAKEVKEWSKETKKFTIGQTHGGDRTFEMSIAQIMALHCVSKQEDAKTHLLSGGMTLKRLDKKGHVVADYENINLSITDIQSILETLTDRQREVADKLQEFMNTICSAWGNEISMARFGVEMFGLPDYFPIKVSEATVPTDNTKDIDNASLFRLLNMSFTKSRNQYADQSIEVGDIFDIFAQHSSDMAKYNALALPVLDFNKFYSIHGKDALNKEYGVVKTLKSVFGDEANGYLRRFVRDLNGSQNVSRDVIGNTFFKNAKLASVAANFRVVLLQPTAFYKASAVMDNKYLLKASAYMKVEPIMMYNRFKKAVDKAEKYCGIVQWKALGYYDTDISKGLTEKIKHADTFKDKVTELSMKGAEIADKATFATLWTACEFEIRDTRKELKVGSKEYYDAVGKRLREVIYATQVVDSTMTRSDMMRSTDGFDKLKTTFGSEPIIAYNMLLDMVTQYTLDKKEFGKKESKKRNGKKIRKVVTAYVITNVMAALVESGFDWLRDDDDEEMDMVEFMKTYLKNFAFDMSIGNKLPFIKEFYSALQGYSSSRMDTQWLQYLQYALNSKKPVTVLNNLLKVFSQMSGYAFYNAYRDIMATLNKLDIFTTEDLEEFFDGFLD